MERIYSTERGNSSTMLTADGSNYIAWRTILLAHVISKEPSLADYFQTDDKDKLKVGAIIAKGFPNEKEA